MTTDAQDREVLRRMDNLRTDVDSLTSGGAMAEEDRIQEISISKNGINLKSVTVNTVLTLVTALGVAAIGMLTWTHTEDSRAASSLFVGAVKEQTTAMREATTVQRESNCLQSYQGPPQEKGNFCRNVAR